MTSFTNFLFVPATKPERFAKAMASGADLICIDLEDSVPPTDKARARDDAIAALGELDLKRTAIRTNGLRTAEGLADLLALTASDSAPALVFLPMVESAVEVEIARQVLGDKAKGFVPLIETVLGLENARSIASEKGVAALMFGGGDFSGELGVKLEWEPLFVARSRLAMACASARVGCVDVPFIDMEDEAGLATEAARVKALGFSAKAAIHPKQVAAIRAAFGSSEEELAEARAALAAYEAGGGAAVRHDGKMLEAPVIARYQRIVEAADREEDMSNA